MLARNACLALLACSLPGVAGEASAAIPAGERAALIALYNSTSGAGWTDRTNWRNAEDTDFAPPGTECTWLGVTCDGGGVSVASLTLRFNNLSGPIPSEIANLAGLSHLDLIGNHLSGTTPPEIGSLTHLRSLSLDNNQLSGPIPPQIGSLTLLGSLGLGMNQLTGAIPASIGSLTGLTALYLNQNQLSGSIPPEIGNLPALEELWLGDNQLSGSVPPDVGNLGKLEFLYLANNQLSGPIPRRIGNLAALRNLSLWNNQLSGPIPLEIASLRLLRYLGLWKNQLSGPIPSSIGNLTELTDLDLGANRLSGPVPATVGTLSHLEYLQLEANDLRGPIPATLANLTALVDDWSDLRWNGLYTSDTALRDFLDTKQRGSGGWEGTQTVAPTGLAAGTATLDSVPLSWSPILYTSGSGGYRLWYGTRAGGPYNLGGTTGDKTVPAAAVSGLSPGTTYYFAVDTVTEPSSINQNTVVSERTPDVSATTAAGGAGWLALSVARDGPGTVSSSPGGIACGGACSATFAPGTPVTLTAAPGGGSTFLGWGGGCAGTTPTCSLTMSTVQTATAAFSTPASSFYTVTPCRVFDSRNAGLGGPTALASGTESAVLVAGYCGIPTTASAVSLNVTAVSASAGGHLRLYASGAPRPGASSINYAAGQTRANNAVLSLGANGALVVYVGQPGGTVHVVLDVNGYFQ